MELRDYLKVIRRRWRVIVASLLIVVAAASLLTLRMTPEYTSESRLFVSTSDQSASQTFQGGTFAIQRVSSYADLVKGQELSKPGHRPPRPGHDSRPTSPRRSPRRWSRTP